MHNGKRTPSIKHIARALFFFSGLSSGCAPLLNQGYPVGAFYHSTKVPSLLDRVEASGEGKAGPKMGKACTSGVLGVAAWGDASIDAAKKAGSITSIHSVEVESSAILGFVYVTACTVVHGS